MPRVDYTGRRFGKLVAVSPTSERTSSGNVIWKCLCDCGNYTYVSTSNLNGGRTNSCGCLARLDLTGKKFGKLTALKYAGNNENGKVVWLCECECGTQLKVDTAALTTGHTTSCGCTRRNDLTGQVFGRLTVLNYSHTKDCVAFWRCKCSCGKETEVRTIDLTSGKTRSCGCLATETRRAQVILHGLSGTRVYKIWQKMIQRCENPSNDAYKYYGGLGVIVCDEWQNPVSFYEWAGANGYAEDLSIDRINPFRNYCPENCRWATSEDQGVNKRKYYFNLISKAYNEHYTKCVSEYASVLVREFMAKVCGVEFWSEMFRQCDYNITTTEMAESLHEFVKRYVYVLLKFYDWAFKRYMSGDVGDFVCSDVTFSDTEPQPDLSYANFVTKLEEVLHNISQAEDGDNFD